VRYNLTKGGRKRGSAFRLSAWFGIVGPAGTPKAARRAPQRGADEDRADARDRAKVQVDGREVANQKIPHTIPFIAADVLRPLA
jgi:hypothetical protein